MNALAMGVTSLLGCSRDPLVRVGTGAQFENTPVKIAQAPIEIAHFAPAEMERAKPSIHIPGWAELTPGQNGLVRVLDLVGGGLIQGLFEQYDPIWFPWPSVR